ncbi:hypothetical protein FRB96_002511 [Tulasnella sp. 330]|nr:hypothetical protein FRB96_002511 [Tulasnella sp. 330]KAG8880398.1 hypothetical protein FRB97_000870 [Tulasnella sp. 331]KAG8886677.1 hypothetical protein FRB98_001135 [Tulasnella sp. 332]
MNHSLPIYGSPYKTVPSGTTTNELKDVVEEYIKQNFKDTIYEVDYDSFAEAYLYSPSKSGQPSVAEAFQKVALICVKEMQYSESLLPQTQSSTSANVRHQSQAFNPSSQATHKSASTPATSHEAETSSICYRDGGFHPLKAIVDEAEKLGPNCTLLKERRLYHPLVNLMTFIQDFYRKHGLSGDDRWPQPADPLPDSDADQPPVSGSPLNRVFANCHNKPLHFDCDLNAEPDMRPDLALLLDDDEARKSRHGVAWKDVRAAIEVKFDTIFDESTVAQVARYARGMRIDQPDRNFFFTLLISKDQCRVFRWDSAGCYVTEPLKYHDEPAKFIELIGRFAALDPRALGFDLGFSNAGRVHSSRAMETTLTIAPNHVSDFQQRDEHGRLLRAQSVPGENDQPRVFQLGDILARVALDYNFGRSTTVWPCYEVVDGIIEETPLIIKQNHQDDARPHEGSFYVEANEIEGVGRLMCSQTLDSTREYHERIPANKVLGCWRKSKPAPKITPTPTSPSDDPLMESLLPRSRKSAKSWAAVEDPKGAMKKAGAPRLKKTAPTSTGSAQISRSAGIWKLHDDENCHTGVERVLLRHVFNDFGAALSFATDAEELITAAHDHLNAIWGLSKVGILHRDISFGNLLLTMGKPRRGFLIDLGLATRITKNRQSVVDGDVHHHLTGTLPFIAYDLLEESDELDRPPHQLRHDIESLFWVLLWTCLVHSKCRNNPAWVIRTLEGLNSSKASEVSARKSTILSNPNKIVLPGRYSHATPFLRKYAGLCNNGGATYAAVNQLFLDFKGGKLPVWEDPTPPVQTPFPASPNKRGSDPNDGIASVKRPRNSTSTSSSRPH